jgi:hypothetical protein
MAATVERDIDRVSKWPHLVVLSRRPVLSLWREFADETPRFEVTRSTVSG